MIERFVVDNSIVLTWCFKGEANPYADAILNSLADAVAVVPEIWPLEVVTAERSTRDAAAGGGG
jgi:hypothetical protein